MTKDEMRKQAIAHFERIKTSPYPGDLNYFEFIDRYQNQGGSVFFYTKGFDRPQAYFNGEWHDALNSLELGQWLAKAIKDNPNSEEI